MTTRRALLVLLSASALYVMASLADDVAGAIVTDSISVAAVGLMWSGAAAQPPRGRRPWGLITTGFTLWVVGDLIWDGYLVTTGAAPDSASLADLFYLLAYPVLAAGMVTMIRHRAAAHWRSGLLDAIGVAMASALAAWVFLVPASGAGSTLEQLLAISYPLGDVMLLAALAWLILSPGIRGTPSALMLVGFGATLVLDVSLSIGAIAERTLGGWFDNAYPLTYLLIGLAVVHERSGELTLPDPSPSDRLQPARVVFLGVALFSGPVIGTFTDSHGTHRILVLVTTIGIGTIVLTRFLTALREVERSRVAISLVAGTDALTGLDNRRRFLENGERCLDRLADESTPAGALMIDIDHFKQINDTYGHASGDAVLTELSRRCAEAVRPFDLVGRLGGDEFAIVLPGCGIEQTRHVAARLRALVAATPFPLAPTADRESIPVTLSIGGTAGQYPSMHLALADADAALYEAKRRGRDQLRMSVDDATDPDLTGSVAQAGGG